MLCGVGLHATDHFTPNLQAASSNMGRVFCCCILLYVLVGATAACNSNRADNACFPHVGEWMSGWAGVGWLDRPGPCRKDNTRLDIGYRLF